MKVTHSGGYFFNRVVVTSRNVYNNMCFSQGLPSHTQNSNNDITSKVSATLCIPGLQSWDSFSNAPMLPKFRDILIFKNRIIIKFCTVHGSAAVVEYFKLAATHSLHPNHNKKSRLIQLGMSYECLCDTGLPCWKKRVPCWTPDSKVYGANMGPTWVLSTQMGPILVSWTLLSGTPTHQSVFHWDIQAGAISTDRGIHDR